MRKYLVGVLVVMVCALFVSGQALALSKDYYKGGKSTKHYKDPAQTDEAESAKAAPEEKPPHPQFPDKGWHKGPYLAANIGMLQVTNDDHVVTGAQFDGAYDLAFGLTFGWDIADWIGPMLQINYSTATGTAGDAANAAACLPYNLTAAGECYPARTFPVQNNVTEHAVDVSLFAKGTVPYFTKASWQPKMVKIIPYLKIGGMGNAVYVNASTAANKVGAVGGGPAFGGGVEFFIWKGIYFAIDATESLIFQKAFYKNLTITTGGGNVTREVKITNGGMQTQFALFGLIGWHF